MLVRVTLSPIAKETYDHILHESNKFNHLKSLVRSIGYKIELIKLNPNIGHPIAKRLIPQTYIENDGITNLFHVELAQYWRMLYSTVKTEQGMEIIIKIIEILDHPTYDKRFGYQRK